MRSWGKTPHVVVALNCLCFSLAYADEATTTDTSAAPAASAVSETPNSADAARDALKQKASDVSAEKDLEKVFQSAEKSYSLSKKGEYAMNYDLSYSFYRDKQIDIALGDGDSSIKRFRIQDDSQHSFTNTIDVSYGLKDNLTLNMSLPLVYKMDTAGGKEAIGLGDVGLGVRWQPIPLKRGLPTTTLYSSLSLATGDSPFEINASKDLSTGKGYYSLSAGISMSKIIDPVVMYGSASLSTGTSMGGLNQEQSGRRLISMSPGQTLSTSVGLAYSLNYDVSISASYQQSISTNTRYTFLDYASGDNVSFNAATQLSSILNYTLSLRTSPTRIVNFSVGFGLSEDTPDVNLGLSMPLEFLGLARE